MALVNRATLTDEGILHLIARDGWLFAAIAIPVLAERLSSESTRRAVEESNREGRALQRALAFRDLHDTVLQTFARINWQTASGDLGPDQRAEIRATAHEQWQQLNTAMLTDERRQEGLRDSLYALVREYATRDLLVRLSVSQLTAEPPEPIVRALVGAIREALTNVSKHARTPDVWMTAADTGDEISIHIRDNGVGFDPSLPTPGFGIAQSIQARLKEAGGHADITSAPSAGTTVTLVAPVGALRRSRVGPTVALHESQTVDVLAGTAIGWFALVALAYRIALSPLQALTALANLNLNIPVTYTAIVGLVVCGDVVLLASVLFGRLHGLLRSPLLLVADAAICGAMNLWAAHVLPVGTQLAAGHDILWTYVVGVVAFWTVARGAWAGLGLVAAALALQFPMAWLNGAPLDGAGLLQIASRQGWLVAAFLMAWMVSTLARSNARRAVEAGIEAGRTIERTWALRDTYTDVSASLARIVACCDNADVPSERLAKTVRGLAMSAATRLRSTLQPPTRPEHDLAVELTKIADAYRARGLRVEFVRTELTSDPPGEVGAALLDATRSALDEATGVAGAVHVVVRAASTEDGLEITIRARGRAGDVPVLLLASQQQSIGATLAAVGAHIEHMSASTGGARVRLTLGARRDI
ncbi:sensor histidine kinase [Dactylosporangium darangshiense]|uniref:sensor histidine kinase n=1 Tax=Dactylosporangium darangshiense TaxID=579108 RepID=UPI003635E4DB